MSTLSTQNDVILGEQGDIAAGWRVNVDMGTPIDVWNGPTEDYPFPASAQSTTIESDSVEDAPAGTGAHVVNVVGLLGKSDGFKFVSENVQMGGQSQAPLANNYYRVLRASVGPIGSNGVNVGNISIKHGVNTIGYIAAGEGRSSMAIYTVPGDKVKSAFPKTLKAWISNTTQGEAKISVFIRPYGLSLQKLIPINAGRVTAQETLQVVKNLQPGTDVWVRVVEATANNLEVTATFSLGFVT